MSEHTAEHTAETETETGPHDEVATLPVVQPVEEPDLDSDLDSVAKGTDTPIFQATAQDTGVTPEPVAPADGEGDLEEGDAGEAGRLEALEREGDVAADYLEELLDIADLDGDLDMDVDGDRAAVSIVGADLSQLVGAHGEVLDALQELTRLAVYRETGERSRLMLDVSGYRADQRARLVELARERVSQVRASGERLALDAMTPFERKVVHDAVAEAGLTSESEGVEPRRFVVILPA